MATRTVKAAGGNWSAAGTWVEGAIPTSADDVVLNATSGQLTINATAVCRSFDCTGYTGILTHNAFTLTVGDGSGGSFKLVAGMTYAPATSRTIIFAATTTGCLVTTAGKTLPGITFSGIGGGWTLQDNLTCQALTHQGGTLNTNGKTLTFNSGGTGLVFNGTGIRTLNVTNSTLNITGSYTAAGSNGTITGTGSIWNFTGAGYGVACANLDYGTASFNMLGSGACALSGLWTMANLTINGPSGVVISTAGARTITGTLTIGPTACSITWPAITPRTIALGASGVATLTNTTFTDTTFTGTNTPVSGTGLVNGGNNSGISFRNRVVVSGTAAIKPIKIKIGGSFVAKPVKVKVGGTFI